MVLPLNFWILFAVCMIVSSIGFKNYLWFISLYSAEKYTWLVA